MQQGVFSKLDDYASDLDGVVLDLGVSSMQLDQAERGFSFMRDGPLDMRMSQDGPTAAELVNRQPTKPIWPTFCTNTAKNAPAAASRAPSLCARPITTTLELAGIVEKCLPRPKPGQSHPATRSFQALRIAVNNEYRELFEGLMAAERALKPGGKLAVVTFHSVEDRMVKRFLTARGGRAANANRYAPETVQAAAQFTLKSRKAIGRGRGRVGNQPAQPLCQVARGRTH